MIDELIQDIICIPKKYPFTNSDYLIVSTIQSSDPTIIMKLYLIDLSKFIKINVITIKNLPEWNNTSRIIDMNPKHPRIQYSTFSFELFDDIAEGFERYLNEEDVNSTNYNNLEKDFIHLGTFTTCLFDSIISVPILIDLKNIFMDFEQLPCFSRKSIEYILIEYEDAKYCLCGCWIIGNQIIYLRKDGILTITKRNMKNENLSLSSPSRSDTSTFQYQHQLVSDKQLEISSAYLCVDESKSQYMDMIVVINDTTLCCINLLDNIPSVECNSRQNICEMTYRWSHSFKRINSITIDWLHFSCLVNVEKVVFNVNSKNGRFVKRISIPDYATLLSISEENQDLIFSNSCGTVFMK